MNRYLAFISYRHRERDQKISSLLRRGLENHSIPKNDNIPENRRVFRDTDELPTSTDLGADIEAALKESGWLIALCSEEYVNSKWCMREIDDYLAMGRKDRILPVLISGDAQVSVPEKIRDVPIAADLRGASGRELKIRVRQALPALLSRMSGVDEHRIAQAERGRRFSLAAGIIAAVTAAVLGFAFYATYTAGRIADNNEEIITATALAETEEKQAVEERNNALEKRADYYANEAWKAIANGDDVLAVEMALKALPEDLHGGEPVSESALNALRLVLNLPSAPKDAYQLLHSVETDFKITGVPLQTDYQALLEGEQYAQAVHMINFETGELSMIESEVRKEAAENGYSYGYTVQNGWNNQIWYGPEKQMKNNSSQGVYYTLNGEPFYADHILQNRSGFYLLAWLEEPGEGQTPHMAVFLLNYRSGEPDSGEGEAVCEIPLTGKIRCASFSHSSSYISIIDENDILRLYNARTGEAVNEAQGQWSFVSYPNDSAVVLAVSENGEGCLLDTINMEKVMTFDSPSPVKQLWYCKVTDSVLACCEDGFRVYDFDSGKLLNTVLTKDEPNEVLWGGYDSYLFGHSGNTVVAVYDRCVEVYTVNTVSDTEVTDATVLYREGIRDDYRNAFYSSDGKYLFTESSIGDICKWDISTGELLWENEANWEVQPNVHDYAYLSKDGSAVWRAISYMNGAEKIDAETGETIYNSELVGSTWSVINPVESPQGSLAFVKGEYGSGELVMFDPGTGEEIWRTEHPGEAVFSEDGSELLCIQRILNRKEWTEDYIYRRFDAACGDLLEEKVVLSVDYEKQDSFMYFDDVSALAVIIADENEDPAGHVIWLIDMHSAKIVQYEFPREGDVYACFPYEGGAAVKWTEDEPNDRICAILPDGTIGHSYETDSPEGAKLAAAAEQMAHLGGEEVIVTSSIYAKSFTLKRVSDQTVIMDLQLDVAFNGMVSPDGTNFCVYGTYLNPTLIQMSDEDVLVEKAKRWLDRMSAST